MTTTDLPARVAERPGDFRILTGDRPTGPLHLGHYFGTLAARVALQNRGVDLHVLIADYQVITDRDTGAALPDTVTEILLDYLAAGIDPRRATVYAHSAVPEANQLMLPFLSLVSTAELNRNPTVKEEIAAAGLGSVGALMFTYPVHQAADILCCRANLVPVGRDQLPHVELTRTIARRFNDRYAPVFAEPEALLTDAPLLLGTDGRKMGKSRGNAITLRASADETAALIKGARTDSIRHISYDPEHRPEVANLLLIAALCRDETPRQVAEAVADGGSEALKKLLTEAVNEYFRPLRARRAELATDRAAVRAILREGNERTRALASDTLSRVRTAMNMTY